jgi:hypothetical protein
MWGVSGGPLPANNGRQVGGVRTGRRIKRRSCGSGSAVYEVEVNWTGSGNEKGNGREEWGVGRSAFTI